MEYSDCLMIKNNKINIWINNLKKNFFLNVKLVKFNKLDKWIINDKIIYHKNKNFFQIIPYSVKTNFGKIRNWCQPLIVQKEVGILGIIKKKNKYLLQAKLEPGNINKIQLSPTVQATKSNYLRKHGGKKTLYLNFFQSNSRKIKVISKARLSEQGSRYLNKLNYNILIESKKKIKKYNNFIWVDKQNLSFLIKKKNLLNMDTISILASVIKKNSKNYPVNTFKIIINKLNKFNNKYFLKIKRINFKELKLWKKTDKYIFDIKKIFFSIIGIKISSNAREVKNWSQPIISDHSLALNGYLVKKIDNTYNYLLQIVIEPGFKYPKFTPTICIKNFKKNNISIKKIPYLNFFFNNQNSIYDITHSDEGGRFYNNQSRNIIKTIKDTKNLKVKDNFVWVSHNQIVDLIKKNLLTIEARNLFACFNIDNIK